MIRRPTDASGFTLDTSDDDAIKAHLAKHPEDAGHELTVERDGATVQVRRNQEEATDGRREPST